MNLRIYILGRNKVHLFTGSEGLSEISRYPRREIRKHPNWFMITSVEEINTSITNGDEPTLREAMNSTPEEQKYWMSAVHAEMESIKRKNAWNEDYSPKAVSAITYPCNLKNQTE